MITNGSILRCDVAGPANAAGQVAFAEGPAIDAACYVGQVNRQQRFDLEGTIKGSTSVVTVLVADFDPTPVLAPGDRLTIKLDEEDSNALREVVAVRTNRKGGGTSHHQIFLKEVK